MSNLKKIFLGLVVCLTTVMPLGLQATESIKITNAAIKENSTEVSNVYWRGGGWYGRGYYGYGGYGRGYYSGYGYGYGYPYYGYGYGYGYPYYGYGYGYGYGYDRGCSSCNSWW